MKQKKMKRNNAFVSDLSLLFCSMPAVEYSKSFITSVVVGKDGVPRIGLHQMEALRADLINAIKRSVDPKVRGLRFH